MMSTPSTTPTWSIDPSQPKGQQLVAQARQLLNCLEFSDSCGSALEGEGVIVSVAPTDEGQDEGCFGIVVSSHARTAEAVTWSTLRIYATPKSGGAFGLLGPSLNRLGQATIDNLPVGEYRLRAYHRVGDVPFEVKSSSNDEAPFLKAVGLGPNAGSDASAAPEWTMLPPQVCAQDGITLHRSVKGNQARLGFSSDDETLAGVQIEFCVVLRRTGEQLVTRRKKLRRMSEARGDEAGCQTETFEFAFPAGEELDVCYRIVGTEGDE